MDFTHVGFAVGVDDERIDLLAVFQCVDHWKSAVGGGEWNFYQLEGVVDCHCGEASGGVDGGVHVAHDGIGEFRECVGECADGHVGGDGGGGVELGEVAG